MNIRATEKQLKWIETIDLYKNLVEVEEIIEAVKKDEEFKNDKRYNMITEDFDKILEALNNLDAKQIIDNRNHYFDLREFFIEVLNVKVRMRTSNKINERLSE